MESVLIITKILLAAVFCIAAFAKFTNRSGLSQAVIDFGIPAFLSVPISYVLPPVEMATSVALIYAPLAWWGTISALTLLIVFSVAITLNLVRGKRPHCNCFGQLQSAPISSKTVLRNGFLIAAALFVLIQGRLRVSSSKVSELFFFTGSSTITLFLAILLFLLIIEGWLIFHLTRQNGRLFLRMDKLEAQIAIESMEAPSRLALGAPAPTFDLPDLAGNKHTLRSLTNQKHAAILVFSDPSCKSCFSVARDIARWQKEFSDNISFAVISRGTAEENRAKAEDYGSAIILLQKDHEVAQSYFAEMTPSAVLILPNGTIGSPLSVGEAAIKSMVAAFTHRTASPSELLIGSVAPDFDLPDSKGRRVSLSQLRGRHILLVFFNPHCGYCTRMAPELAKLPPNGDKEHAVPIVITTGSLEDNQRLTEAYGLECIMLLQDEMEVASIYHAGGTPMGYLIDEQGNIASKVTIGAQALLKLAMITNSSIGTNGEASPNVAFFNTNVQGKCQCGKADGQCLCSK